MYNRLGKFEILRSLGQGAMGEVFLARDPAIGREVAVKTILASTTAGAGAKDRFAREAKAAGTLNHPGIVTIHEFGEDQGVLYLAMEFVEGDDLQDLLSVRALSKTDLLEVLAQVAEALAYAHRKGVLHRDVKPSNIRVIHEGWRECGRLQAKLMDFGIARISESTLTSTGLLMGTVAYMAPEYVKTGQADPRGDLFATGVMLYEGLTGQLPFAGDTTATILYRLVHEPPRPLPPSALLGASPALRGILDRILSKEPERRYADGDAFAKVLRSAKDPAWPGEGAPTVVTAMVPTRPARGSAPWRGGLVAAGAVLAVLGAGAFAWHRHRADTRASVPAPAAPAPAQVPAAAPAPPRLPVASSPQVPPPEASPSAPPKPIAPIPKPEPPPAETVQNTEPMPSETSDPVATQPDAQAAAKEIDSDPAQAHRDLVALIQAHPGNPHLRALNLVALAKSGEGAGFVSAWDQDMAAGVDPKALLLTPRFDGLLKQEKRDPTLPYQALERLKQAYAGLGNPQQGQRRRWGWQRKN